MPWRLLRSGIDKNPALSPVNLYEPHLQHQRGYVTLSVFLRNFSSGFLRQHSEWLLRHAEVVAPELIGCLLVKRQPNGELLRGA